MCRQDISAYIRTKTFIIFLSSRVIKKISFKRPNNQVLSYEDYNYGQNRDPKILGGKGNKSISRYMMEYGILCCNKRISFDLSSNKQLKWAHPKIVWYLFMK